MNFVSWINSNLHVAVIYLFFPKIKNIYIKVGIRLFVKQQDMFA